MTKQRILSILQKNSRTSEKEIADRLNVSEEEVSLIIKELEETKTIIQYTALINKEKIDIEDNSVEAHIEIGVQPERERGFEAIAMRINKFPEVKSLYLMSGGYDLLAIIEGSDIKKIAEFVYGKLATIKGVTSTKTHFQLKKYKINGICLEDSQKTERLAVSP